MAKQPAKRRRAGHSNVPNFGAPTEADTSLNNQRANPSSSQSSTRRLPVETVPALTTLCARKFVVSFVKLRNNEAVWGGVARHLQILPDHIVPKVFAMLRAERPTYLKHELITTVRSLRSCLFVVLMCCISQYFLRGSSVTLSSDLPGVTKSTILDIARINPGLCELELSNFDKLADSFFASLLRNLPSLSVLVLR